MALEKITGMADNRTKTNKDKDFVAVAGRTETDTHDERKFPTITDVGAMFVLFVFAQFVAATIASALGLTIPGIPAVDQVDIETYMNAQVSRGEAIAIMYPLSMLFATAIIYAYVRMRGGRTRIARFSKRGFNPNILLSGIFWIIAAQLILEPATQLLPDVENAGVGRGFWASITTIVVAPVLEELLCRGIILETLRRRWNNAVAIIVSALFFGLVHANPTTALAGVIVGIIFGVIYVRTSSLFSVIILHAINNAIAFALISFDADDVTLRQLLDNGTLYWAVYASAVAIFIVSLTEAMRTLFKRKDSAK